MLRTAEQLRSDVLAIWHAGVAAVASTRLLRENLQLEDGWLIFGSDSFGQGNTLEPLRLADIDRLVVVGAGKAGAGMAAGVELALGEALAREKRLTGLVNVPADCVRPLKHIELVAARPAGVNEPTAEGLRGAEAMLRLVEQLGPRDLCLALFSGGASALLPAPVAGVSLDEKRELTRFLSAAGANIGQLNLVRKQLSRIKGGGLARACRAGYLQAFVISDVPGDPLEIIASGPTVPNASTPAEALAILEAFGAQRAGVAPGAVAYLRHQAAQVRPGKAATAGSQHQATLVVASNATAVDAAGLEAERRGYSHAMISATHYEPAANEVGEHLAALAWKMRREPGPDCLISGGEPVVTLAPEATRGLGGRNQQLALAALDYLNRLPVADGENPLAGLALLSGGTDGEDGPTDAAGALIDAQVWAAAHARQLKAAEFLARNDAYHFFDSLGGLLRTGPTHTNVCDLRVIAVDRVESERTTSGPQ